MASTVRSRLSTDTRSIASLNEGIQRGEVKVPQFQRPFVWKEEQAIDLLDSISNHYPIGSLLLWKTQSKLSTERNIGDFILPETDDMTPTDYVLDGQQRLTVIFSCLGADYEEDGFQAAYDLENEEFIKLPDQFSIHVFPLRWISNTTKLLDFRSGLRAHDSAELLNARFDDVYGSLTNYQIPVVTLKDLTVEEVCPIFERINSSGTRLSTYDLMVAATWSTEFDLNEEVAEIQDALSAKGFSDVDGNFVLKCLAAVDKRSIKKPDVVKLRQKERDDIHELTQRTKEALLKTVDLLSTEFGIYSFDFLPYEALGITLCYVLSKTKSPSAEQLVKIRQWFWLSAFNERYRGASEHYISKDLDTVHDFAIDGTAEVGSFGAVPSLGLWRSTNFRSNNSRSRAYILALALRRPRNLTNGALIDVTEALSIYNQKQFHHIYPRAHLKRTGSKDMDNALANICMLSASENRRVSDGDPAVYIPKFMKALGAQAPDVLASNLMPTCDEFSYENASFDEFVQARAELVHTFVSSLCDGEMPG